MPVITVAGILTSLLAAPAGESTLPELLCTRCAVDLSVSGVGIALMTSDGHQGVVAASDDTARTMERLQYTLGEGPCLDSSSGGRPVLQPELTRTAAARWPGFGPAVFDAGVRAIFAFPLQVGGLRLGVLDLYRDRAGALDRTQLADALTYADAAGVLLMHLQHQMGPDEGLHPDLIDPQDYRPEVHQATGMVTVQAAVGLAEALLLLRARAFATDRTILDVAREVIARRLRFELDDVEDT